MNPANLLRIAVAAMLGAYAVPCLFGQNIVVSPTSLTFDLRSGVPAAQLLQVSLSSQQVVTVDITPSQGLLVNGLNARQTRSTPASLNIAVDPSLVAGATLSGSIQLYVPGLQTLTVPVCYIRATGAGTQCGGSTGTGNFFASPSTVSFVQSGTIPPASAQLSLSASGGIIPTYYTNITYNTFGAQNWLQVAPAPGFPSNSSFITITPVTSGLLQGNYSATVTLTPQTLGYSPINIPVNISVGTSTGTGNFYASPSSITFSYPTGTTVAQTQYVNLVSALSTSYGVTVSPNLASVVTVSPALGTAPTQLAVTLTSPSFVPVNTSGYLTVTPSTGSLYPSIQIPIYINPSGTTVGSLLVDPTSLTFSTVPGTTTPLSQNLNVTSPGGVQQAFSVSTSSPGGFLTALASSTVTPAVVTVSVNPAFLPSTGTYTGYINLTPSSGVTAGVPTTVAVTINVGTGRLIIPSTTSATLEARAGATLKASTSVRLDVAAGVPAIAFSTTQTTTSGGNWLSVMTSGEAPSAITILGDASTLAPGSYTGKVTITPTSTGIAPFDINVTFTVTASGELRVSPTTLSFAHQTTSTTNPVNQTVAITSTGTPLNWTATATTPSGGWLAVTPASGITGTNNLTVSVNPSGMAAGTYTGTITVSSSNATNPAQTISVTLTVTTPVIPEISAVVNAGSFSPTLASPGLIATITGTNLGPVAGVSGTPSGGVYPTSLGETQVLFDGRAAPLLYVSATQLSFVMPYELAGRVSTRVTVEARGQRSRELELRVADAAPGVFTLNQSGSGQGAVLNQNGTINGPQNPAARGSVVVIYGTGLGVLFPQIGTGTVAGSASMTSVSVRVRIGGVDARVLYAGSAPGLIGGTNQINVEVPASVTPGSAVPISIEAGTGLSQPTVTIAVQ